MQKLQRIIENNFLTGYNDRDKPENLRYKDKVYMADIKNGFVEQNKIIKRSGYTAIGNAPVAKAILGQARHEPAGGSKYVLRARDNSGATQSIVETWSGSGNWADLTGATTQTAGVEHEFVTANDATYIFNGTDTVLKTTNGTSTSTVAGIPKGQGGKWWHNFLFVYGVTTNPSRLYFSDVTTPETFDAVNGFIDVNAGDNETIIGIESLQDTLFIFKPSRVFTLTGYGTGDFTLASMGDFSAILGTNARRSIVAGANYIAYLNYVGQTPHFRVINNTQFGTFTDGGIISDAITGTMNRIQKAQIPKCAGIFDGRKFWWAICTSGTTNNEVVVYDTINKGWTRHTGINANVFNLSTISGSTLIQFGDSTTAGLSYKLDTATNDNGAAISFLVDTPAYQPEPGYKCRYKYLYMTGDVESAVSVDVDYSPDGFTFSDLGTFSLTGAGAAFGTAVFDTSKFGAATASRGRLDFAGGTAYYMQYRFSNSVLDEEVSLREWELFYRKRKLRSIN